MNIFLSKNNIMSEKKQFVLTKNNMHHCNLKAWENTVVWDLRAKKYSQFSTIETTSFSQLHLIHKFVGQVFVDNSVGSRKKCKHVRNEMTLIVIEFIAPIGDILWQIDFFCGPKRRPNENKRRQPLAKARHFSSLHQQTLETARKRSKNDKIF